ncbi:MAG TPA: ParA family partition ATPase [Rudaea sp.]|jgi:chromosome partitioning protein
MQTLVIAGQKGGSGKTTLAVHLAIEAQRQGQKVALIDADPQASASAWSGARKTNDLAVAKMAPALVQDALRLAANDGFDLVIVDTPPHASSRVSQLLESADLIILPVQPSVLDLAALPAALELVRASGARAALVLSYAPVGVGETAETRKALEQTGWPVLETVVHTRMAFRRALAQGQAVAEFEPSGKAAFEIRQVWREIQALMAKEKTE